MNHGRLTLKQMADIESNRKGNPVAVDVVRETLCKLLTARYVERCPAPEPVVSTPVKEEETTTTKFAEKFEPPVTIEQRILEAAMPEKALRFSIPADSDDCPIIVIEETILWRANFEEFICHLRREVLVKNVRKRLGDGAATILDAILKATKTADEKVKIEYSVPLPLDAILAEVQNTDNGPTMTTVCVRLILLKLGCPLEENLYSIDLQNIIKLAQNDEVESSVLHKFGSDALTIFKLLSEENCFLTENKIAKSTGVQKNEVVKLLFMLMKDDYVRRQELLERGTERRGKVTWGVNKLEVWERELDRMYHAAFNLKQRMAFEHKKDEELLDVPRDRFREPGPLQNRYKRLQDVTLLLGSSFMNLDDAIMLFHDF